MFSIVLSLLILIYCLVTLACLVATIVEGERMRSGWDVPRVLGLVVSLVWPLVLLAVISAAACGPAGRRFLRPIVFEPEREETGATGFRSTSP